MTQPPTKPEDISDIEPLADQDRETEPSPTDAEDNHIEEEGDPLGNNFA